MYKFHRFCTFFFFWHFVKLCFVYPAKTRFGCIFLFRRFRLCRLIKIIPGKYRRRVQITLEASLVPICVRIRKFVSQKFRCRARKLCASLLTGCCVAYNDDSVCAVCSCVCARNFSTLRSDCVTCWLSLSSSSSTTQNTYLHARFLCPAGGPLITDLFAQKQCTPRCVHQDIIRIYDMFHIRAHRPEGNLTILRVASRALARTHVYNNTYACVYSYARTHAQTLRAWRTDAN